MTKARDLGDFISDGTIAETVTADGLNLGDNEKIQLGASQDLQIYHDGSNSYIDDQGAGNLFVQASNVLWLRDASGTAYFSGTSGNEVALYHNGSEKLATTSTGVDITGTIAVSGDFNATSGTFTVQSNGTDILNVTSTVMSPQTDGAISIGSASNAFNDLHLDGSAYVGGNFGVGTSSPATQASVQNASTSLGLEIDTTSGFASGPTLRGYYRAGSSYKPIAMTGSTVHFGINDVEKMRIGPSGQIGLSGANYGTAGQVLTSGGSGAAPAWADAGSAADEVELAITETIAAGDAMQLNSDGSIDKVFETSTTQTAAAINFLRDSGIALQAPRLYFFPNSANKFIMLYLDNSNSYPTVVVGEISGTSISYGTPVVIRSSNCPYPSPSLAIDHNDPSKFVVLYANSQTATGHMKLCSVSGTTITILSGEYDLATGKVEQSDIKFIPGNGSPSAFVAAFRDPSAGDKGRYMYGSYSGTTFTFQTVVNMCSNQNVRNMSIAFNTDDPSKFATLSVAGNDYPVIELSSISGTTITPLSQFTMTDSTGASNWSSEAPGLVYDNESGHYLGAIRKTSGSTLQVGAFSVSGSTISKVSNPTNFGEAGSNIQELGIAGDTVYGSQQFVVQYAVYSNPTTKIFEYDGSGGFTTIDTYTHGSSYSQSYFTASFSPVGDGRFITGFRDTLSTGGRVGVGTMGVDVLTTNLDITKLHGIAQEAGVNGNSISVAFGGIDETQTGMTPGSTLYIQGDGSLGTTSTDAKKIGRAITATKLIIDSSQ